MRPDESAFRLDSVRRRSQSANRPPQSSGAWSAHPSRAPCLSEEKWFPLNGEAAGDWRLRWPHLLSDHIYPLVDLIGWSAMCMKNKETVEWEGTPARKKD